MRMHHSNCTVQLMLSLCRRNDLFILHGGAPNGRIKLGSLGVASHHFAAGGKSAYRKIIHYLLSLFFIFTVAESQPIVVSDTAELAPSIDPPVNVGLGPIVQHPYYPSHPTDARPGQQYQGHDQTIFYGLSALLQSADPSRKVCDFDQCELTTQTSPIHLSDLGACWDTF